MIVYGVALGILFIVVFLMVNFKPKMRQTNSDNLIKTHQMGAVTDLSQIPVGTIRPPAFMQATMRLLLPPPNCSQVTCLALTFDDGPNSVSTPQILGALEAAGAHATFFEIGKYIGANQSLLIRMSQDGDDIGNHSWSHPDFTKLTPAQIRSQIDKTQKAITSIGIEAPAMFRPPYEYFELPMLKYIKMPVILWNVDPKDWAQKSSANVAKIVKQQAIPGGIIVMHDKTTTAGALAKILHDLSTKYQFVTVSQLLGLNQSSKGVYFGLYR